MVAITWRTTHLRTRDNDNLVIPNSKLADERVLNYLLPAPPAPGAHQGRDRTSTSPPTACAGSCSTAPPASRACSTSRRPRSTSLSFEPSAVLYELRVWVEDMAQAHRIASDVRARIWEELRARGDRHPLSASRRLELSRPARRGPEAAGPRRDAARLYVAEGPERGRTLALDGTEPATVGRSRACSLPSSDPNASKEHLRIAWEDGAWRLTDLAQQPRHPRQRQAGRAGRAPAFRPHRDRRHGYDLRERCDSHPQRLTPSVPIACASCSARPGNPPSTGRRTLKGAPSPSSSSRPASPRTRPRWSASTARWPPWPRSPGTRTSCTCWGRASTATGCTSPWSWWTGRRSIGCSRRAACPCPRRSR